MTPLEAAKCAKIAYVPDGAEQARRLGFSYRAITNRSACCWVGHRGTKTVVAMRGTVLFGGEKPNLDLSLLTDLVPWVGPGLVHEGYHKAFWHVFGDVKQQVRGRDEVYFTGHSMGGALALLAATLLPASRVFCFASPRVGNGDFADFIHHNKRVTRFENRGDFLTKFPQSGAIKMGAGKSGGSKGGAEKGGANKTGARKQTGRYVHGGRTVRLLSYGHSLDSYIAGVRSRMRGG